MIVKSQMTQLRIAIVVFVLVGTGIGSMQDSTPPGRLRVAVLGFANETGVPEAAHWSCDIERLLSGEFGEIKAIKPGGGVEYARRQLGVGKDAALMPEQARKMGELIEAQRVVWGGYERHNEQWRVRAHVLNIASGKVSGELISTSADWFELRDELTKQILGELSIRPSETERQKMGRRWTSSPDALEWYIRTCAYQEENKPLSEQEDCTRKAIAADPQFARAHLALSAILSMKGQFAQAEQAARRALSLSPDFAGGHRISGVLSLHLKKYAEAEQELREAHRLDPDDARVLIRLAELSAVQQKLDDAIAFAEKAKLLEPIDAPIHAFLGFIYTFKGNRDKAMVELKEAERLDSEDMDVLQRVGQAYERLREIPLAVERYEKLVIRIKQMGGDPRIIRTFEDIIQRLKTSLAPTFIEASMPKVYTEQSLQDALRERLTEDEMAMVVNPIAGSEEMKRWAEQLTEGTASDLDKAKALFDALSGRLQSAGGHGTRTAREVFAAWDETDASFNCQENAKLFIALARDVNIKAFYVHVHKDYKDKLIHHDCAAVFANGKTLLIDPAYHWFGVPHKDFAILDDMQTIAHQLFQPTGSGRTVARCQLAAKLHPDFAWGQLCLVGALCQEKKWDQARTILNAALRLEPDYWECYLWQGIIANVYDGNSQAALGYIQKALELNPESASAHFVLATIWIKQGKPSQARDEFRAGLRYDPIPEQAEQAYRAIAQINEAIGIEYNGIETNELKINPPEKDN